MTQDATELGQELTRLGGASPLPRPESLQGSGAAMTQAPAHMDAQRATWQLARDFPAWYYAVIIGADGETKVVSVFHVHTAVGAVAHWYDDPENQHRGLPLLASMQPRLLGDYGGYLAQGRNLQVFVALCRVIDDLPDPLVAVQVIECVNRKRPHWTPQEIEAVVRFALGEITEATRRRREEFSSVTAALPGLYD